MPTSITKTELYVGAITGTSIDGLDLALVECNARPKLIAGETRAFPRELREALMTLARADRVPVSALGEADTWLGEFTAVAILELLASSGVAATEVRAIGSHGQTIRHAPSGEHPFTLQIGNPSVIAEHTGILTVADFRRADLAAGGEAAPLVPAFHAVLFRDLGPCAVLNIGGIANLTVLDGGQVVSGFDTGPGNTLLDAWCQASGAGPFDRDGALAATGSADSKLLDDLLAEPYFAKPPPKSTGPELFNLAWLQRRLPGRPATADVQATLVELTARSAADAVTRYAPSAERLLICGGGRCNRTLMDALCRASTIPVEAVEAHGVDGDRIEAMTFAWLAQCRLEGRPANQPQVTGAKGPRLLGALFAPPPQNDQRSVSRH